MPRPFKGTVNLDVRDSKPGWPAFLADTAPKDAPNVLVILYDGNGKELEYYRYTNIKIPGELTDAHFDPAKMSAK